LLSSEAATMGWDVLSESDGETQRSRSPLPIRGHIRARPKSEILANEVLPTRLTEGNLSSHNLLCAQKAIQVNGVAEVSQQLPPPTFAQGAEWWQKPLHEAVLNSKAAFAVQDTPLFPMSHVAPCGGILSELFGAQAIHRPRSVHTRSL
jgi:hypothetical protein